jgi:hypothetical protein
VPEQPPFDNSLSYASTNPYGNASTLVRLAGIFNLIMGGINAFAALIYIGIVIAMHFVFTGRISGMMGIPPATYPAGASPPTRMSGMPPEWIFLAIYSGYGLLNLAAGGIELAAGFGILKRKSWAFPMSIAAISAGFLVSFTCSLMCILPIGNAVYTLVIICMENSRRYLRNQTAA